MREHTGYPGKIGYKCDFVANYQFDNTTLAGVSRELSLHPVHLTPDSEGNIPPSALIPFCSYQGDASILGQKTPEFGNFTLCDKFQSTILEGQLCYSLDVAKYTKNPTKAGKGNGLFLLLDPTPNQRKPNGESLTAERNDSNTFKVYIHTLSQHTALGPGAYAMHDLKKMAYKESFKQLPESQKRCHLHNREDCQTNKFLKQVKRNWLYSVGPDNGQKLC